MKANFDLTSEEREEMHSIFNSMKSKESNLLRDWILSLGPAFIKILTDVVALNLLKSEMSEDFVNLQASEFSREALELYQSFMEFFIDNRR